uniref:Uncharacterized protein n=1 Tax=Anguilla anguilla TaxID=7936 RepID=A0A0E9WU72_ANGAN
MSGNERIPMMHPAVASPAATDPSGGLWSITVQFVFPGRRGVTVSRTWLWGFCSTTARCASLWMSSATQQYRPWSACATFTRVIQETPLVDW